MLFWKKSNKKFAKNKNYTTFANGELAEWSIAAVLKTVEGNTSGGSNPSLSARDTERLRILLKSLAFFGIYIQAIAYE